MPIGRRAIVAMIAGVTLAGARDGRAQPLRPRPVVAVLRAGAWDPPKLQAFFIYGLSEEGLETGRDYDLIYRATDNDPARAPALVAELVALGPAVIVAQTTELVVQLKRATSTIPIVGTALSDPIGLKLIADIHHPGGNVTGMLSTSASTGKQLELLREIVPNLTKVGMLLNPSNAAHRRPPPPQATAEIAALGLTLVPVDATVVAEIEPAFKALAAEGVGGLMVGQDALFNNEAPRIAELALAAKLPTVYGFRNLVDAGGLLSYGGSLTDRWRHGGWYAGKIIRGEKPGDLPIEQQEKLELILNMKTATALGLTIPRLILARADELIE